MDVLDLAEHLETPMLETARIPQTLAWLWLDMGFHRNQGGVR
jgi:hypothetical protein